MLRIVEMFRFPILILVTIISSQVVRYFLGLELVSSLMLLVLVLTATIPLCIANIKALLAKKFALDYIALLAILVAILSGQYLVAAIIVLMLAGGSTLEEYGTTQAKQSLSALTDRIPNSVILWSNGDIGEKTLLEKVEVGARIFVRKGEVIPLDGRLVSKSGYVDESSLTGEPYLVEKAQGDVARSGTVNEGDGIIVEVTKRSADSTYHKIIEMVRAAQQDKAPLIRLADRYSVVFTLITLGFGALAYLLSGDMSRVLAVLVIATPCPLILATPIALMGGMNASAKHRIIMKKLASIEVLSRVTAIIFDKTGTITMGKPSVAKLTIFDSSYTPERLYGIAEAIERNSLHPLAKAIVRAAHATTYEKKFAKRVSEKIGVGIEGEVDGITYRLHKSAREEGMAIQIGIDEEIIGLFFLEDKMKQHSKTVFSRLKSLGLSLFLFTGDKREAAERVVSQIGGEISIRANCTPEVKRDEILKLKRSGKVTAMIGDGINDAPALAAADVGIVFSNEEQTAASEAADIIFIGGDFDSVYDVLHISSGTVRIALESIIFGIGLSMIGMLFAAMGAITPIAGAFIQETIDVLVILNALRASRLR